MASPTLLFAVNGERVELDKTDPSTTLNDYLRLQSKYKGTKLGCGEGGCGACTVLVSTFDPASQTVKEVTANSCLLPLGSLHLRSVTTTEGLGSQKDGFHPVQQRLAGFHGSQCGFCTPGMVMSMYGKIKEKQGGKESKAAAPLSKQDVEAALQGNLCRCTGYRPILDACKSFAGDIDVEDLGLSCFRKDPDSPLELPCYDPSKDPHFPDFLCQETTLFSSKEAGPLWLSAGNLEELFKLMAEQKGKDVKLVVGNTSCGYYKEERPEVYIDIKRITKLTEIHHEKDGLLLGAAVTLADAIAAMEEPPPASTARKTRVKSPFAELAAHMRQVATPQVRYMASLAGNLIMAQSRGFPSDLAPIFYGCGAELSISGPKNEPRNVSMERFLKEGLKADELIVRIFLPAIPDSSDVLFKTYRAAVRPTGNAVAHINAAFRAEFASLQGVPDAPVSGPPESSANGFHPATPNGHTANGGSAKAGNMAPHKVLKDVVLIFGALGERQPLRAEKTEAALRGKKVTAGVLLEGLRVLDGELRTASDDAYRLEVAAAFVYSFFSPYLGGADIPKVMTAPVSDGHQKFSFSKEHFPVSEPVPKKHADLQASGEAVYVDDVGTPANLLYAAFVGSEYARARLKGVDASAALKMPGVVGFVDAHDIPGRNVGCHVFGSGDEPLLATDRVAFVGHPFGLVVADSPRHAADAARSVKAEYDEVEAPVVKVDEATEFVEWAPFVSALNPSRGDHAKGLQEAPLTASGKVACSEQKHFYMEPMTAMAVPDEDGFMTLYSSCQGPDKIAGPIAEMLGIPKHSVRVITRRVGGGFGGKVTRAAVIATAAALAARKFGRPVKLTLDRNTDMMLTGGREPVQGEYEVGFTEEGKITALKMKVLINCGWNKDLSDVAAMDICHYSSYNFQNLKLELKGCKTNVATKTTMRGPGRPQGALLFETVLEHVAAVVKKPVDQVQEANFYDWKALDEVSKGNVGTESAYTMPRVWKAVKKSSNYERRAHEVSEFNAQNRWRKRGIAMTPVSFDAANFPRPARVSVFHDGSIIIDCTGVEMGQGLHTKVLQTAAYALSKPLGGLENGVDFAKMRVVDQDSHGVVNAAPTAGSTASEASCEAVRRCCAELIRRLEPALKALKESAEGKPVKWNQLIGKAAMMGVHLSAEVLNDGMSEDKKERYSYFVYAAAVSEVELDVLTGAFSVVRTDILFDAGKSLNPAVDLGQIEGAFIQGLGFFTSEEVDVDADGNLRSDGTWTYKIPTADSIPRDFRVELLQDSLNKKGVLSSKASGEPPLQLAYSIYSAIRHAVAAAREDVLGPDAPFFRLDAPASMPRIKAAIGKDVVVKYLESLVQS